MAKKIAISLRELLRAAVIGCDAPNTNDEAMCATGPIVRPDTLTSEQRSKLVYDVRTRLRKRSRPTLPQPATTGATSEAVRVTEKQQARRTSGLSQTQLTLFGDLVNIPAVRHRYFDLRDLVREAWVSMFRRWPEDHVVANPLLNREFISRCRALGASVSEYELNRALLNGRKAGLFTGINRVEVAPLSQDVLDLFGYGCEIAGRYVQYVAADMIGTLPTIDRILCDPQLRSNFDRHACEVIAGSAAPVNDEGLYYIRMGLLRFRKSGRESSLRNGDEDLPGILLRRPLPLIDPEKIPNEPGIYRIVAGHKHIFLGHTLDLRARLRNHLAVAPQTFIPATWKANFRGEFEVLIHPAPSSWRPRKLADVAYFHKLQERPSLNLFSQVA